MEQWKVQLGIPKEVGKKLEKMQENKVLSEKEP